MKRVHSINSGSVDDRGNPVEYRDPLLCGSELSPSERERVNRHRYRARYALALGFLGAGISLPMLFRSPIGDVFSIVCFAITGACIIQLLVLPRFRLWLWNRTWKSRYKEVGRCPACQYELTALEPEADGCTVCPECGGAWRLSN